MDFLLVGFEALRLSFCNEGFGAWKKQGRSAGYHDEFQNPPMEYGGDLNKLKGQAFSFVPSSLVAVVFKDLSNLVTPFRAVLRR